MGRPTKINAKPYSGKTVHISQDLRPLLDQFDLRIMIRQLATFLRKYCMWDELGEAYLNEAKELRKAVDALVIWDEEKEVQLGYAIRTEATPEAEEDAEE